MLSRSRWRMRGSRSGSWTVSSVPFPLNEMNYSNYDLGWLSPELYLRRPPAKNEQYRLDRMLQAAAQRGVRVNIIVYKEVTQALTCMIPGHNIREQHEMLMSLASVLLPHKAPSGRPPSQYCSFPPSRPPSGRPRTHCFDNFVPPKLLSRCCFVG